eukprot:12901758-Alexandrium_andersonii.AAC.1
MRLTAFQTLKTRCKALNALTPQPRPEPAQGPRHVQPKLLNCPNRFRSPAQRCKKGEKGGRGRRGP